MSRTIRNIPVRTGFGGGRDSCHPKIHRTPHGFKQAVIGGARKKAIPPTAWDDKHISAHGEARTWKVK